MYTKGTLFITLFALFLLTGPAGLAQEYRQTIRGKVFDAQSNEPLIGAIIELQDTALRLGTYSDDNGNFSLKDVPVGRRTIRVRLIGYSPRVLSNLMVISGKELVLDIGLQEEFRSTETIEITAQADKRQAENEMSTVSSRVFSMEETSRYAGSLNDPSRMASNFAGVVTAGDNRNDIVIRGNAPTGLLWRLEGIDIPNPNHFATQGANGGPIGILNNNLLANSDFMTGAFPAEYSNANSGAFDLKLRSGNNRKRESMFQIGFNGIELMTEGPFSKSGEGSYLLSYRYSTLAVFDGLGISFGDLLGIPYFQDFSFKVNLPNTKAGTFSIFGIGGMSSIDILESELTAKAWKEADFLAYEDVKARSAMGVIGASHQIATGKSSYLKTTLSSSGVVRSLDIDSVITIGSTLPQYEDEYRTIRYSLATQWVSKLNSRNTLRIGGFADHYDLTMNDRLWIAPLEQYQQLRDYRGGMQLARLYGQWQHRFTEKITINTGINSMLLALNSRFALEPRVGVRYQASARHALSAAYGLHHQMQPLEFYFIQAPDGSRPNEKLDFSRSQHYVLAYDWTPWVDFRVKTEVYYQLLDRIPVEQSSSSFSILNIGANFDRLPDVYGAVNRGTGENYGLELTVEKFLSKNYYFLFTTSLFESTYKGSDGQRRSTAFNQQYVVNGLAGAEFWLDQQKKKQLFFDFKGTLAGGVRYTPVDVVASRLAGESVKIDSLAFSEQARPYFRLDLKAGIRLNHKKISQEFAFNIQNITNYQNVLTLVYDPRTEQVIERYQLGFFPIVQYKINL